MPMRRIQIALFLLASASGVIAAPGLSAQPLVPIPDLRHGRSSGDVIGFEQDTTEAALRTNAPLVGAVVGGVVGGGAGVAIALLVYESLEIGAPCFSFLEAGECETQESSKWPGVIISGVAGAAVGSVIGYAVGTAIRRKAMQNGLSVVPVLSPEMGVRLTTRF